MFSSFISAKQENQIDTIALIDFHRIFSEVKIQNEFYSFTRKGNKDSAEENSQFYFEEVIAIKNKIR